MFLTSDNVVYFLLERGLIHPEEVVDGDFRVVEILQRNRNFKVLRRDGKGLFLKQAVHWDQGAIGTVLVEAQCYRMADEDGAFRSLREIVPRFHYYDERRSVLVTELLTSAETLAQYYIREHSFPEEIGIQLGQKFGRYHHNIRAAVASLPADAVFPRRLPWIFLLHQATSHMLQHVSGGNKELFEVLRGYPEFADTLNRLGREWKRETLIHGDTKWDNCLLVNDSSGSSLTLKLVDWELADWGDPAFDVGGIFSAFLAHWIQSLPLQPGGNAMEAVEQTSFPIETMQPVMRAFWRSYVEERELTHDQAKEVLQSSVLFCGVRLIQTAYEHLQDSPHVTPAAIYLLQASMNILSRPDEAAEELIGIAIQ